jgi:hypothetical protein
MREGGGALQKFKSMFNSRRHISFIHNKSLPPKDADGSYESSLNGGFTVKMNTPDIVAYYACPSCPSCWTFPSDFDWIKKHISTHETQHNVPSIPIKTKKNELLFRDASTALHSPKRPKITNEHISTLSPVATITSSYNNLSGFLTTTP